MLAQKLNRPWAWFVAGAVTLVVGLGYTGNLTSITAADQLLNPDARNYWESSAGYIQEVFDFCSTQAQVTGKYRTFKVCYDNSLDGAVERGYITERDIAETHVTP